MPRLLTLLGEAVAPPRCMGCFVEGVWLCAACRRRGLPAVLECIGCRRPADSVFARSQRRRLIRHGGRTCRRCRSKIPLVGVVSAGPYSAPLLRHGIHWLKFKGVRACGAALANLLADHLSVIAPLPHLQREAVLIPVPLHRRRARERGFNQSADIAAALSVACGIPTVEVLVRTRSTWTQTKLPAELRADNTRGAFLVARDAVRYIRTKRWCLLVDDVATTGSTLSAAAEALLDAQLSLTPRRGTAATAQVWGVTVARG